MRPKLVSTPWQKLCRIVANPTVSVMLMMAVVLVSAWVVIETDSLSRRDAFPVLFGHK